MRPSRSRRRRPKRRRRRLRRSPGRSESRSVEGRPVRRRRRRRRQRCPAGRCHSPSLSQELCDRGCGYGLSVSRSPPMSAGVQTGVNAIPLGHRDDPQEEETKIRVWVADRDCPKIIGKGGRTMRDVEARSRTRLKVQREDDMDPGTKERHVDIVGTTSEQKAALELLLELATFCRDDQGIVLKDTRPKEDPEGKPEEPRIIEVLPEEVGRVLGRKGETIKVLERDSNTKIEVDKASGRLEIHGQKEAQERALELILLEVSFAKGDGIILKDEPKSRQRGEEANESPPLRLWVKDREAGKVIGRGGETVRDIMEKTGADIRVQKSDKMRNGEDAREIKIFGHDTERNQALQLILGEVSWAKDEDKILKMPIEDGAKIEVRKRRREQRGKRRRAKEPRIEKAADSKCSRRKRDDDWGRDGAWVCGTCGGDHRTKECPHVHNIMGVGMQIGMQMGMQAMGVPSMPMGVPSMGSAPVPMMPMPLVPGMPMPLEGHGVMPAARWANGRAYSPSPSCSSGSDGSIFSSFESEADSRRSVRGGGALRGRVRSMSHRHVQPRRHSPPRGRAERRRRFKSCSCSGDDIDLQPPSKKQNVDVSDL